jgi:uncharacterized protein (TIGR00304 family)
MNANTLFETGLILVFAGFILAFISAFVLVFRGSKTGSKMKGGGIVMLGPFPIIFGTDKGSVKVLILLSIILMIVVLAFTWFSTSIMR